MKCFNKFKKPKVRILSQNSDRALFQYCWLNFNWTPR